MNTTIRCSTFISLLITLSLVAVFCSAQNQSETKSNGIYLTNVDLKENRVADERITSAQNDLSIDMRSNLVVIRNGDQALLPIGSIAGYYKNGSRYRAYCKNKTSRGFYKIIDESGLIVYSRRASTPKTGDHTWYYYSKSIDSPLRSLTRQNLRMDFKDNPRFVEKAEEAMKTRSLLELTEGRTKINELYKAGIQP